MRETGEFLKACKPVTVEYAGLSQTRQKAKANTQGCSLMDGQTQKIKVGDERQEGVEGEGRGRERKGGPDFDFMSELGCTRFSSWFLCFQSRVTNCSCFSCMLSVHQATAVMEGKFMSISLTS